MGDIGFYSFRRIAVKEELGDGVVEYWSVGLSERFKTQNANSKP
jgi:hypothetical protein